MEHALTTRSGGTGKTGAPAPPPGAGPDGKREECGEHGDVPASSTTPPEVVEAATSEAARLAELAEYMEAQGELVSAESLRRSALAMLRAVHGDHDREDVARALLGLGTVLSLQGAFTRAKPVLRESLAMARRVWDGRSQDVVADILGGLALAVRGSDGPTPEVIDLLRERVSVQRRMHDGKEHSGLIMALLELARMLQDGGDRPAAEAPLREALAVARRVHEDAAEGHGDIIATLTQLGKWLYANDDPSQGEPQLREALDMARRLHGGRDHGEVATLLASLALAVHELGHAGAEDLLREAVAMRGRLSGDHDDCGTATCLGRLGRILQAKGDLAGAALHLRRCVAMELALHGNRAGPHASPHMLRLAGVLKASGRLWDAFDVLNQLQPLLLRHYGEHHDPAGLRVATSHQLGAVLDQLGLWWRAEPALQQALDLELRLRGGDRHVSDTQVRIVAGLRGVLMKLGSLLPAERVQRGLLERLRRQHGSGDHWLVAIGLSNLARVLLARRKVDRAGPLPWRRWR